MAAAPPAPPAPLGAALRRLPRNRALRPFQPCITSPVWRALGQFHQKTDLARIQKKLHRVMNPAISSRIQDDSIWRNTLRYVALQHKLHIESLEMHVWGKEWLGAGQSGCGEVASAQVFGHETGRRPTRGLCLDAQLAASPSVLHLFSSSPCLYLASL